MMPTLEFTGVFPDGRCYKDVYITSKPYRFMPQAVVDEKDVPILMPPGRRTDFRFVEDLPSAKPAKVVDAVDLDMRAMRRAMAAKRFEEPKKPKLTKAERSQIAKDRWQKRLEAKPVQAPPANRLTTSWTPERRAKQAATMKARIAAAKVARDLQTKQALMLKADIVAERSASGDSS